MHAKARRALPSPLKKAGRKVGCTACSGGLEHRVDRPQIEGSKEGASATKVWHLTSFKLQPTVCVVGLETWEAAFPPKFCRVPLSGFVQDMIMIA